ncbi:MAG: hypothetical protein QOF60_1191 [Actinomycetota bacterium]|nr:hypothetical protein [Actinomycetota bacterium]
MIVRASTACVGYRMLSRDGGVFSFGQAPFHGAPGAIEGSGWVALSATANDNGYVAVTASGRVSGFGDAGDAEAMRGDGPPLADVVDIDWLPAGDGFRILDAAGGVFCFGTATFHGSIPAITPPVPAAGAVAMASTPTGAGYWILDRVGGVYAFGDAGFHGSVPGLRLPEPAGPAVDLVAADDGEGYRVLEADGAIRSFGAMAEVAGVAVGRPVVAFAPANDDGCVVVDERGLVFPLGTGPMFGSLAATRLAAPVVDIVSVHARVLSP